VSTVATRILCRYIEAKKKEIQQKLAETLSETKKVIYEIYLESLEELKREMGCG